jgi:hypothetical protein
MVAFTGEEPVQTLLAYIGFDFSSVLTVDSSSLMANPLKKPHGALR